MNTLSFHFFPGRHAPSFVSFFDAAPGCSATNESVEELSAASDDHKAGNRMMTISGPSAQYVISLPAVSDNRCA
jgi:hypothetical protein